MWPYWDPTRSIAPAHHPCSTFTQWLLNPQILIEYDISVYLFWSALVPMPVQKWGLLIMEYEKECRRICGFCPQPSQNRGGGRHVPTYPSCWYPCTESIPKMPVYREFHLNQIWAEKAANSCGWLGQACHKCLPYIKIKGINNKKRTI